MFKELDFDITLEINSKLVQFIDNEINLLIEIISLFIQTHIEYNQT